MTDSPARVVQYYLIAKGVGINPTASGAGIKIFRDKEPADNPTEVITVYETTPKLDGRLMRGGDYVIHPGIMVRVRTLDPDVGKAKIGAVLTALQEAKQSNVVIGGHTYNLAAFSLSSGPMPAGEDDKERKLYTVNGTITVSQKT